QRINHEVFKDPQSLMVNLDRVTAHARAKLAERGHRDITRRVLTIVKTRDNELLAQDSHGNFWRTYFYIEGAKTHNVAGSAALAFEAAKAFGQFQALLADFDGQSLSETIPDFHNTPSRYQQFVAAVDADPKNRAGQVTDEIEFFTSNADITSTLVSKLSSGDIPVRVTHNDTKINNVMIDEDTNEGICVIDLDTVMPGSSLYDFGDLVRTSTSPVAEDEKDLNKVMLQRPMFKALVEGYLRGCGDHLTKAERDLLVFSGKLLAFEVGLRFLGDHLNGDLYFKVHRQHHNLDRCRTQIKLIESIDWQSDEMQTIVDQA
ncbi:MAG: phosphotransferase, partial [Verrucomicrobiales bacterium]|nr:phosphotransferase [Verrucomicrobiales bacterium]